MGKFRSLSSLVPIGTKIGIDLGTTNTVMTCPGREEPISFPTIYAKDSNDFIYVGDEALKLTGKNHKIELVEPVKHGEIQDPEMIKVILRHGYRKVLGLGPNWFPSQKDWRWHTNSVVIAISCGLTSVARNAVYDAGRDLARTVTLIEQPVAHALAEGLLPDDVLVIDIGGGTTDFAAITPKEVIDRDSLSVGGKAMDQAIQRHICAKGVPIDQQTANQLKHCMGAAKGSARAVAYDVASYTIDGEPKTLQVTSSEIEGAIGEIVDAIAHKAREFVGKIAQEYPRFMIVLDERSEQESRSSVRGPVFLLTGGGSLLPGVRELFERQFERRIRAAKYALHGAAIGAYSSAERPEILRSFGIDTSETCLTEERVSLHSVRTTGKQPGSTTRLKAINRTA